MKLLSLLVAVLIISAGFASFAAPVVAARTPSHRLSVTTAVTTSTSPHRLGFWIDERDMWSGVGLAWSPQQFVTNYFDTAPYPSAMVFATAMTPTGPRSPGAIGEAQWLSQVASIAQSKGLNVEIIILFFVNLSGATAYGVADQTSLLTQYMSALGRHSNIYGAEYEREYFGNTAQEVQKFKTIINNAGYVNVDDPTQARNFPSDPVLDYSTYPYFGGTIPTASPSGSRSLGVGYGETGAPSGNTPNPAWTQASVQAIVNKSPASTLVLLYAGCGGSGQPGWELWSWATLHQWIWTDPTYTSNYLLSTA